MSARRRLFVALLLSCSVYALPLITVHTVDLFGWALWREWLSGREVAWKAADLALGAGLQVVLFAIGWWTAGRSLTAAVTTTIVLLIPTGAALNTAYLFAIPAVFLIEFDRAPDLQTWTEVCAVDGMSLDPVRGGASRGLAQRGEAWVRNDVAVGFGILRADGCVVEPASIPGSPVAPGLQQALPDGSVVYVTMARGSAEQQYWLLRRGTKTPNLLRAPAAGVEGAPVVSTDGGWVAWTVSSPARERSLHVEPLGAGAPIVFTHPLLQRATVVLVEWDMTHREIVVNRDFRSFVALHLDGTIAWGPLTPADVAAQTDTFRYVDGQWAGWDAYVEDRRYRLGWSTRVGKGEYQVPKGRSIVSAALDVSGRYVAVSTTTSLNLGAIKDTVLVLDAATGKDVFRKALPPYARSEVAFLGDGYFVYSDINGARSRTHVLSVPGASGPRAASLVLTGDSP